MCGIAGIFKFDGSQVSEVLLNSMGERLSHRGPDDSNIWLNQSKSVGFSHRRLSIIDVASSVQPMTSKSGNSTICFNGEIFNYQTLRKEWDYPYSTNGDTETLLAGYEVDRESFLNKLHGQFAFAIYDKQDYKLKLFRDRLGVLPLFYYVDKDKFIFASEIKALLVALDKMPNIDKYSLSDYLSQRGVPAPDTLYEGIKKLRPGHKIEVDPVGNIEVTQWYEISKPKLVDNSITELQATNKLDDLLSKSVKENLVADVPVGAYLSGGIDSSLICALIKKHQGESHQKLHTFSAKFSDGSSLDETPFARTVSNLLETQHHEVSVSPKDFEDTWPRLSYIFDAPIPEPPDIAFSKLAKLAKEHVTVVLSGEGSDELFAGYPKYQYARLVDLLRKTPHGIRSKMFSYVEKSLPASMHRQRTLIRAAAEIDEVDSFKTWFAPFTQKERKELFDHQGHRALENLVFSSKMDVIKRMSYQDFYGWLPDNILERGDRTSMMNSLELRPPFLDVDVLEFSRTLPSNFLVDFKNSKIIVRDVARRYLPEEIFNRNKHGFKVPLDDWFRNHLREFAYDHLTSNNSLCREMFDTKFVKNLLDNHVNGKHNDGMRIYTLVALELWYRHRATN